MKPTWLDAPDWAEYLAEGELGWIWFELKPNWIPWEGYWEGRGGKCQLSYVDIDSYEHTLERRP